jgi:hypothetical protein
MEEYTSGVGNKYVLQTAIGAYSEEAYTDAKRLSSTGIVNRNTNIDTSVENFMGQMRWFTPINPIINIASLIDPTDGIPSNYASAFLKYIKTVRTHGAYKINLAQVVTGEDGLARMGRNFANVRLTDEHNSIVSVLKGVAISEALRGASSASGLAGTGGQTFSNDPTVGTYGFYVDLGADTFVTTTGLGAARIEGVIEAFGMAFKDYEPEYAYLVADPSLMAQLRSANLIDSDRVTDGNIDFESILSGKFRLIQGRTNMSLSSAELTAINTGAGIDIVGTKTSFVVLPGAIALEPLAIPDPVGIDKDESAYHGGGTTDIWYRWGYVAHPTGYDWRAIDSKFPSDADYKGVTAGAASETIIPLAGNTGDLHSVWRRKASSALSLGILPIFHS